MSYPEPYLQLYNNSALALKAVHSSLRVGGPATAGLGSVPEFLADTQRLNIPVDFVSSHSYPGEGDCGVGGSRFTDPECFSRQVNEKAALAKARGLPFLLTEYKEGLQPTCHPCLAPTTKGNCPQQSCPEHTKPSHHICPHGCTGTGVHADTSYAAAFIFHTIPMIDFDAVEVFSWWCISDIFEEGWLEGTPFHGGFGLLTAQNIAKPAYRAFEMLKSAGDQRIAVKVSGVDQVTGSDGNTTTSPISVWGTVDKNKAVLDRNGTSSSHGGLQLFASNFWAGRLAGDPRPLNTTNLTITVDGLPVDVTHAVLTRVDDNSTRPYWLWKQWNEAAAAAGTCNSQCSNNDTSFSGSVRSSEVSDAPCLSYLSAKQLSELEQASLPVVEHLPVTIDPNGATNLSFVLGPYAVVRVQFAVDEHSTSGDM